MIGLDVPVYVATPEGGVGVMVTVYVMLGSPPSEAGGENATTSWPSPGVAVMFCGAEGAEIGEETTVADGPVPAAFSALAAKTKGPAPKGVKLYEVAVAGEGDTHEAPPLEETS